GLKATGRTLSLRLRFGCFWRIDRGGAEAFNAAMTEAPPSNAAQMASPSFRLAALDQDFLLGESMRGARFLLEYEKADQALKRLQIKSTIVVFGSARTREDGPGKEAFWYNQARAFGRIASERGGALRDEGGIHRNVITTGGGP